jgi:hypothetical protein
MTTRFRLIRGALLALALNALQGQTLVDLRTQSKRVDFTDATATAPFKTGTSLPSTCQTGEAFFKTDVAAGQNLYGCAATNTWAVQSSGGGPALPLNDFQPAVNGQMLTVAEGRARVGSYVPVVIASGSVSFTSGSGNVKVFIDSGNNLVCHMQTGIAGATSGALICSNVSTPSYPANSIPVASVDVTGAVPSLTSDDRAFLATRGVSAGTGIRINDSGGVASIGIDTATVPQLGAGSNDFTGAISALELRLLNGSEGTCSSSTRGRMVMVFGGSGAADTVRICSKDAADAYAWLTLL